MSYFGFLGHFEKDRDFISWLNKKSYATGYTGLELWHPVVSPWALNNFPGVESVSSASWQWTSLPAAPSHFLLMPWKEPPWAQETQKSEDATWERTDQQSRGKWLPSVIGIHIRFLWVSLRRTTLLTTHGWVQSGSQSPSRSRVYEATFDALNTFFI